MGEDSWMRDGEITWQQQHRVRTRTPHVCKYAMPSQKMAQALLKQTRYAAKPMFKVLESNLALHQEHALR